MSTIPILFEEEQEAPQPKSGTLGVLKPEL
jgi:hypothetical protein